jgi:hypothetical protein
MLHEKFAVWNPSGKSLPVSLLLVVPETQLTPGSEILISPTSRKKQLFLQS